MLKWRRKYEWDEWRQLNPDLPEDIARRQYIEERQMWDNFVDEVRNLFQIRREELQRALKEAIDGFEKYPSGSMV